MPHRSEAYAHSKYNVILTGQTNLLRFPQTGNVKTYIANDYTSFTFYKNKYTHEDSYTYLYIVIGEAYVYTLIIISENPHNYKVPTGSRKNATNVNFVDFQH